MLQANRLIKERWLLRIVIWKLHAEIVILEFKIYACVVFFFFLRNIFFYIFVDYTIF